MTNNNRYNNGRNIRRSSDRARAITKAKARKQNIILSASAIALVAIIAAGFIVFGAFAPKTADTAATSVSVNKDANKAAQNNKQADARTATIASQDDDQTAAQATYTDDNSQDNTQVQSADNSSDNSSDNGSADKSGNNGSQDKQSEDKIETVNGQRVYIDTKRTAPNGSGAPATFSANGKTSYGFDWTYDADNSNFVVRCDYNFDAQQYLFQFYGTEPGTAHVTLYYYTDDNTQVPANLTLTVDDNLNASIG